MSKYPQIFGTDSMLGSTESQSIFEEWLKKNGKAVYASLDINGHFWSMTKHTTDSHQALLVCIEEIEKKPCEHKNWRDQMGRDMRRYSCEDCGAKIRPIKFEVI